MRTVLRIKVNFLVYCLRRTTFFLQLRTDLIRQLVQSGLSNFKVLDSCCTTSCEKTANIPERIISLKETTKKDGIHFTETGNSHLATRAINCLKGLIDGTQEK